MQTHHKFITHRENLVSDSSRLQTSTERPAAQRHFELEIELRSIFEKQRQQLLSEAHSENVEAKMPQQQTRKEFRKGRLTNYPEKLRESQSTIDELTAQISELQESVNFMHDSREFQEVDSV